MSGPQNMPTLNFQIHILQKSSESFGRTTLTVDVFNNYHFQALYLLNLCLLLDDTAS